MSSAAAFLPLGRNNFDLLRLVFATIVCFSHMNALTDRVLLASIAPYISPDFAVKAFFVISGFLIFRSAERSATLKSYAEKRLRRIYPGYVVVVLLSALLLFFTSATPDAYFSKAWGGYLLANLSFLNFLHPTLPGVFEDNKWSEINGALWTLKIEVMFYAAVPVFLWMIRRWSKGLVLGGFYVLSLLYAYGMAEMERRTGQAFYLQLARQLPGQLSYFLSGAALLYLLPFFRAHPARFVLPAALVLGANVFLPLSALEPAALAVIVVFLGLFFPLWSPGRHGDFSYGVYILHFPIIQSLWAAGILRESPILLAIFMTAVVFFCAVLLWFGVEKRFLLGRSHYVSAEKSFSSLEVSSEGLTSSNLEKSTTG